MGGGWWVVGGGLRRGDRALPLPLPLPLPGVAQERPAAASGTGWGAGMPGMRSSADLMFAVQMAAHHESAVQMARLAEQRAQRSEVRALATDIARTQTAEIAQLRAAAARLSAGSEAGSPDRTGMGMPGGMGDGMPSGMGGDLTQVPAGAQFDRAFLDAMIPHHQMGVHMARMVQRRGNDPQIQALAADMLRVQTSEIALMQRWLDQQ